MCIERCPHGSGGSGPVRGCLPHDLDIDVQRLKLLKANHLSQRYALEDQIIKVFPQKIAALEQRIEGFAADMNRLKENTHPNEDGFSPMEVEGVVYTDKKAAGSAILAACHAMTSPDPVPLGQYRGFAMELSFESFSKEFRITLKGTLHHTTGLGTDILATSCGWTICWAAWRNG